MEQEVGTQVGTQMVDQVAATEAVSQASAMYQVIEAFMSIVGPVTVALIVVAGLFLFVIGSERLITLFFRLSYNTKAQLEHIRARILEKRYTEALQVCNSQTDAPEIKVMRAGLMSVENGREAMKSALSGAVLEVNHSTERRLPYISLIANVATLLGLLGTISGLIKTFSSLGSEDPATKAKLLGEGISEAMATTAIGLIVGITAMVIYTVCVSKADQVTGNAQDAGHKLITWIEQSERAADAS